MHRTAELFCDKTMDTMRPRLITGFSIGQKQASFRFYSMPSMHWLFYLHQWVNIFMA